MAGCIFPGGDRLALPLADGCDKCELSGNVVWGRGVVRPALFLVGDYSTSEDDLMGRPFSGRGGDLVRKLLREAGIDPESCYFTNAVKCHPNENKAPKAGPVKACKNWLNIELEKVRPKAVVAMGGLASRVLKLKEVGGISVGEPKVASWYSPGHILRCGRAVHDATVEFFKKVKKCSDG